MITLHEQKKKKTISEVKNVCVVFLEIPLNCVELEDHNRLYFWLDIGSPMN